MKKNLTFFQAFSTEDNCTTNSSHREQSQTPSTRKGKLPTLVYLISFLITLLGTNAFIYAQISAGFELDGNAMAVSPNPPDDWSMMYPSNASNAQVTTGIVVDMPSSADNAFVQGTKDIVDVSTWHWQVFSTPDKDDILHAYAALYSNTKLYFGGDRYATNGDAQIGFWFFQNQVGPLPNGTFSGTHAIGDILILSDFVNGGGVPVVKAYEWVGSGGSDGSLNLLSVTGPNIYAIVNNSNQTSPWPYLSKTGSTSFQAGAFFEGGLDLAALNVNIDPCFTSFLLETRSSQSATAELKDFVWGNFFTRPQVAVNSATICPGGSATLTATVTGGTAPYTYSWSNGATTPSITVSPSSTTSYTVVVTAANGCQSNPVTGTVTVNSAPVCSIGSIVPGGLICNHGNYTISTTSTGTLSWSMSVDGNPPGWGIVGSNSSQTITFSAGNCGAPGFQVHFFLTVTDANGCSSSCTADFAPGAPACVVDIRPAITLTCSTTSQWLLASYATDIVNPTFEWTLGATSLGAGINDGVSLDSIQISAPGTYTFWVHDLQNPANDCSGQVTVQQDTASPGAGATGGALDCNNTSVQLIGTTTTGTQFDWTGPNGFTSSQQSPTATDSGTYTLVVTDPNNGCSSTASTTVTQNVTPPGAGATGGALDCNNTSVQLTGTTTTGTMFSWTGPNGFASNLQNPTVTDSGTYDLTVTDQGNGCTSTTSTTVTQDVNPPGAGATGGALDCNNTSVQLTGTTTTGTMFSWTGPNGFASNLQNPTVSDSGTYDLTVTDQGNGCTSTTSTTVTQDVTPPGAGATGGALNCNNTSVQLTGTTTTGTMFSWTGPNGFASNLQNPTVSDSGTYDLTVTDQGNGCTSTTSTTVTQDVAPPSCSLTAPATLPDCASAGNTLTVSGSSNSGNTDFAWSVSGTGWIITSTNGNTITYTAGAIGTMGTFSVVVTDPGNGCTSSCTVTFSCNSLGEGCTPGYWKNHTFQWNQTSDATIACISAAISGLGSPYSGSGLTSDMYASVFGVTSGQMTSAGYTNAGMTMLQAISSGGGGVYKLARHGVAALLSSCALTAYPYTPTQVLTMVHDAIVNGTPEPTATNLAAANDVNNCPLNNSPLRPVDNSTPVALTAYPNPFNSTTTVEFMMYDNSENADVSIYSITGAHVATLFKGAVEAGVVYRASFDGAAYADGIYFCRISSGTYTENYKLVLLRK
jgi:hypothetical protein